VRVKFRGEAEWRAFAMVVACTGYEASTWRQPCLQGADVRARAHFVGFGAAPRDLLPLQGIGREASRAARIIAEKLYAADLSEALVMRLASRGGLALRSEVLCFAILFQGETLVQRDLLV
jgi:hypothetical protein